MLSHIYPTVSPSRVVVIGSTGFVGRNLMRLLAKEKITALGIGSKDIDLASTDGGDKLAAAIQPGDAVVMLSALTPDKGRDITTFMRNLEMARAVSKAVEQKSVAHLVYLSSDAVYPFVEGLVSENTLAAPTDLYGAMHLSREIMLRSVAKGPYAVLRPTLIYGHEDTHNSYGANRFLRVALKDGAIVLGGAGEETRDHVWVDDVARLILLVLRHKSAGVLNIATGTSISFDGLARQVAKLVKPQAEVRHTDRTAPMTHRTFDPTQIYRSFPEFQFTPLAQALPLAYAPLLQG